MVPQLHLYLSAQTGPTGVSSDGGIGPPKNPFVCPKGLHRSIPIRMSDGIGTLKILLWEWVWSVRDDIHNIYIYIYYTNIYIYTL